MPTYKKEIKVINKWKVNDVFQVNLENELMIGIVKENNNQLLLDLGTAQIKQTDTGTHLYSTHQDAAVEINQMYFDKNVVVGVLTESEGTYSLICNKSVKQVLNEVTKGILTEMYLISGSVIEKVDITKSRINNTSNPKYILFELPEFKIKGTLDDTWSVILPEPEPEPLPSELTLYEGPVAATIELDYDLELKVYAVNLDFNVEEAEEHYKGLIFAEETTDGIKLDTKKGIVVEQTETGTSITWNESLESKIPDTTIKIKKAVYGHVIYGVADLGATPSVTKIEKSVDDIAAEIQAGIFKDVLLLSAEGALGTVGRKAILYSWSIGVPEVADEIVYKYGTATLTGKHGTEADEWTIN